MPESQRPAVLFQEKILTQMFSCKFCEISKNAFVTEHLWWLLLLPVWIYLKLWYWKYKKAIFQGGHLHSRKWHYQHTGNCSLWLRWTKVKINKKFPRDRNTTWKVSKNGVISGPYIPVHWLNTGIHKINLRIQSEYRKIRTRNNFAFEHFSRSESFIEYYQEF